MTRTTLVKKPVSQILLHFVVVFGLAFGATMVASLQGTFSIGKLEAVLIAAATAGVVAVFHAVTGLIPTQNTSAGVGNALGVTLVSKGELSQLLVSVVATFATLFGASLLAAASHVTNEGTAIAAISAAIAAAVAGVVHYIAGLIPQAAV